MLVNEEEVEQKLDQAFNSQLNEDYITTRKFTLIRNIKKKVNNWKETFGIRIQLPKNCQNSRVYRVF